MSKIFGIVKRMQGRTSFFKIKTRLKPIILNLILLLFIILILLLFAEIFSRIIIGNKLTFHFEEDGFFYPNFNQEGWQHSDAVFNTARINNIGARGEDVDISKIMNHSKYVFFGDSFTFGWLLRDNETISEYFREENNLSYEEVINYASPGYGIDHMQRSYKNHLDLLGEGDTIILILIDHDFTRPITPQNKNLAKIFLKHSSFLSYSYERMGPLLYKIKDGFGVQPKKEGVYFDEYDFYKILEIKNISDKNNQKLIVVFYEFQSTNFSKTASKLCSNNQISCITNVPYFINNLNDSSIIFAVDGGHPSEHSNKVVAEGIANFIKANSF